MKRIAALIISCFAVAGGWAEAPKHHKHDYCRFVGDNQRGKLETPIVTMRNGNGVTVELIGAVHIADTDYYKALNEQFRSYEVLLFELVDGQKLKDEKIGDLVSTKGTKTPTAEIAAEEEEQSNPAFAFLRAMMTGVGSYLRLQYQTDGIDYHAKNFVHADVSMEQFQAMQEKNGESFSQLFQKAMESEMKRGFSKQYETTGGQVLLALLGDSSGIKISMAKLLGNIEDMGEDLGFGADSVIVGERNRVALEVFDSEVKTGRKKLGIFYGAAHLEDMENRLEKRGYKRSGERWLTAWNIKPRVDELKK
jgi:hypothetical protein